MAEAKYEELRAAWEAWKAADAAYESPVALPRDMLRERSETRDRAQAALEECYLRLAPQRERDLVELGRETACCCCSKSAVEVWCIYTFEPESAFESEGA